MTWRRPLLPNTRAVTTSPLFPTIRDVREPCLRNSTTTPVPLLPFAKTPGFMSPSSIRTPCADNLSLPTFPFGASQGFQAGMQACDDPGAASKGTRGSAPPSGVILTIQGVRFEMAKAGETITWRVLWSPPALSGSPKDATLTERVRKMFERILGFPRAPLGAPERAERARALGSRSLRVKDSDCQTAVSPGRVARRVARRGGARPAPQSKGCEDDGEAATCWEAPKVRVMLQGAELCKTACGKSSSRVPGASCETITRTFVIGMREEGAEGGNIVQMRVITCNPRDLPLGLTPHLRRSRLSLTLKILGMVWVCQSNA